MQVVAAGFVLLHFCAARVVAAVQGKSALDGERLLRFPSISIVVCIIVVQGSGYAGARLLAHTLRERVSMDPC